MIVAMQRLNKYCATFVPVYLKHIYQYNAYSYIIAVSSQNTVELRFSALLSGSMLLLSHIQQAATDTIFL